MRFRSETSVIKVRHDCWATCLLMIARCTEAITLSCGEAARQVQRIEVQKTIRKISIALYSM